MDSLMSNSLTGKVAEKAADSQVGKDTWCPDMSFKIRMICFLGIFTFGMCATSRDHNSVSFDFFRIALGLRWMHRLGKPR